MNKNVEITISLLATGFTVDEIEDLLNISPQEFNSVLKTVRSLGYNYSKSFDSDGTITIKANKRLNFNPKETIRINVKDSTFHTIITSDFHIGGSQEKAERIAILSDYATSHDIHTIFNTGDIINNYYPENEPDPKIKDPVKQAMRYLRYAPQKEKQIYFNLGGNHDYKSLEETGFDSLRYYEDRRYDQISLGYGKCLIRLKDDTIALAHDIKKTNNNNNNININSTLIFRGHSHKFKNRDNKIIYVPALTDSYQDPYDFTPIPGFLDAEFYFFDNKIYKFNLKYLTFQETNLRLAGEETMVLRPDYNERYQLRLKRKK